MYTFRSTLWVISLFILVLIIESTTAILPTNWTDSQSIAANEPNAYDQNNSTAALIAAAPGNVTYGAFSITSNNNAIFSVNATFQYNTTAFTDDLWSLQWSEDAGITWQTLAAFSATNNPHTNATFLLPTVLPLTFAHVSQNISLRVETQRTGLDDGFTFSLQEILLSPIFDPGGPLITLYTPETVFSVSTANLTYSATDMSNITNCSLIIDGVENATNTSIISGQNDTFSLSFAEGTYTWAVRCVDDSIENLVNISENRTIGIDLSAPMVTLVSPVNDTNWTSGGPVEFFFNFTDVSDNATCHLYINDTLNATQTSWSYQEQFFLSYLNNGDYSWNVTCTDPFGRTGVAVEQLVSVVNNRAPQVTAVVAPTNITVALGSPTIVTCNATATDNATAEMAGATARFFREGYVGADENSSAYSNTSCALSAINATANVVECSFSLLSYSRAGSWVCAVNVTDLQGLVGQGTASSFVETLYAINISPGSLQYGSALQPGDTSGDENFSVTNVGNSFIDITLDGFGVIDGDGLAMNCDTGSIPLSLHRYSLVGGTAFASMTQLTDIPEVVEVNIPPGNDSGLLSDDIFWKVQLPSPLNGTCAGFVTVTAVST